MPSTAPMATAPNPDPTTNATAAPTQELRPLIAWIIRLRWIATLGVAVTIWVVPPLFGISLEQRPLSWVTLGLALHNVVSWGALRRVSRANSGSSLALLANIQIGVDLLFLTTLLYWAGGVENPFACYYVFHVVIASIVLSRRATYFQVASAMVLFAGMAVAEYYRIIPHHDITGYLVVGQYHSFQYVIATIAAIGTMLAFTGFMATTIVARLRLREQEIVILSASLNERAQELQRAYNTLQHTEKKKSEYMRRAAHDLRSPMSAVELMLAVVAEGHAGEISEKGRDMVQRARSKIDRILLLASDLLALSRVRESSLEGETAGVDLAAITTQVVEDYQDRAGAASVQLSAEVPAQPTLVWGDLRSLTEMLENLVSNAVKYTPVGGEVRVSLSPVEAQVVLTVADTGIGIEEDDLTHIGDEFFRARNARESGKEGTGLGMSIVQAIVEAHRGTLRIVSGLHQGTSITVALPQQGGSGEPGVISFSLPGCNANE